VAPAKAAVPGSSALTFQPPPNQRNCSCARPVHSSRSGPQQTGIWPTLDADHITADYAAGVLTLTIPVHEAAKPRSIQVTGSDQKQAVTA
jgi:hypothetical protein